LTLITSPWAEDGTYVSNRCVEAPKIVNLGVTRDRGYKVSVIGYGIARNENFVSEIKDISSSYGIKNLMRDGDHVVSIISNGKNDDAIRLVRELHGWVRKWVG